MLVHELGHVLGYEHDDGPAVMAGELAPGTRLVLPGPVAAGPGPAGELPALAPVPLVPGGDRPIDARPAGGRSTAGRDAPRSVVPLVGGAAVGVATAPAPHAPTAGARSSLVGAGRRPAPSAGPPTPVDGGGADGRSPLDRVRVPWRGGGWSREALTTRAGCGGPTPAPLSSAPCPTRPTGLFGGDARAAMVARRFLFAP